ncbi:biotin--[acetyl-CoA-carboxylase] ligase [uncultured Sphingomonas sp.]|uniref:biotin--[acetyl-CoA-carboxylase] ligase n=1 Tax=uncultured Sphingomonas sp. TaxID=158754 RepID=UPI0025E429E7|nr:biotin--[acetyl-CoA-carboxylase] ligase [uncultured Sphingomonas sp.]
MKVLIRTVAETGSTNADLLAEAAAGAAEGTWLRAERQTLGRGRAGRIWNSPPGNLYASTIVRLRAGEPPAPSLALVAGVALDDVASAYAGCMAISLKWPNDLMTGSAKIAGILLERAGEAVVIGMGVNLAEAPAGLDRPTASIHSLCGSAPDAHAFLLDLAAAFKRWLGRWRAEGLAPVRSQWLARAHPLGTAVSVGGREGLFEGLDQDGALLIRYADGSGETVRAGDVFLL